MKTTKTIKLFIGGNFPRSESGRVYSQFLSDNKTHYANICQASKKDFRNAVTEAKKAVSTWNDRSAYNRAQILYRMAEMTEGKRGEFCDLFKNVLGVTQQQANKMISDACDTFIYYAGFCDKYQQLIGSINPINGPFHNFSTPEPIGVVTLIDNDEYNFSKTVDHICSILVGGNSVIVLLGNTCPAVLAPLAEVFATSDLPAGTINLLTGKLSELSQTIATHHEVRSISFQNTNKNIYHDMKAASIDNMKRIIGLSNHEKSLQNILNFIEIKTVWHPIGT